MIPIETIKRLAIQCGFTYDQEFLALDHISDYEATEALEDFANAIEVMTIDKGAEVAEVNKG